MSTILSFISEISASLRGATESADPLRQLACSTHGKVKAPQLTPSEPPVARLHLSIMNQLIRKIAANAELSGFIQAKDYFELRLATARANSMDVSLFDQLPSGNLMAAYYQAGWLIRKKWNSNLDTVLGFEVQAVPDATWLRNSPQRIARLVADNVVEVAPLSAWDMATQQAMRYPDSLFAAILEIIQSKNPKQKSYKFDWQPLMRAVLALPQARNCDVHWYALHSKCWVSGWDFEIDKRLDFDYPQLIFSRLG